MNSAKIKRSVRGLWSDHFPAGMASLLLLIGSATQSSAENDYWKQFSQEPVLVDQTVNGRTQVLKFTGYSDEMLRAEISMRNPDGSTTTAEIALPVSENMARTLSFSRDNLKKANTSIYSGNFNNALNILRPEVYRLIQYHELPEFFTDLHISIRTLLSTLIEAGQYDEARSILSRISLDKVDVKYSSLALELMGLYLDNSANAKAAEIAVRLPFSEDYSSNISPAMQAADTIRSAGLYEPVISLYRAIRPNVQPGQQKDIDMRLAYSLVLAKQIEEASNIMNTLEEPAPSDRLFSLYKLLEGSRAYREENYEKALDILTRGLVRAQTSYSWVPEMLYLIGDCYARAKDSVAAKNVWQEITLLYPESNWYDQAVEAIATLSKSENSRPTEQESL